MVSLLPLLTRSTIVDLVSSLHGLVKRTVFHICSWWPIRAYKYLIEVIFETEWLRFYIVCDILVFVHLASESWYTRINPFEHDHLANSNIVWVTLLS